MKLLTMALLLAGIAAAQTTYSSNTLVACIGAGHSFTWTTQETGCPANGPANTLVDGNGGSVTLRFSLYASVIEIAYSSGAQTWSGTGTIYDVTFTNPSGCTFQQMTPCTSPGSMAFTWALTDNNGIEHTGTYSTNWDSRAEFRWIRQFLIPPTQQLVIAN